MLQSLRERVQGWIAGVIAGVLCLAFALWGVEYYINNGSTQVIVAKVDGVEITQNQLDVAYNRARQAQALQPADPAENEIFQKQLKMRALNGLIEQDVLKRAANRAGYIISSGQIGAVLQQMPGFQLNGQFSYELFQRTLLNLSYTPEVFLQEIGMSILLQQVQRSLVTSNFALLSDLNRNILLSKQKRDLSYVVVPAKLFFTTVSVTDQAMTDYYKANSNNFTTPEQMSIQYLKLSTDDVGQKVTVTDQELKQYYLENKAAFKMDFDKVKSQVEKNFRQQKADQLIAEQSDQLANLTYTHPDSLKPAADALNLPVQTTSLFSRQGEKTGLLSNPKILMAAFSDNVLKQRNNSDVISIDDHTVIVLRVADYKPPAVKPLIAVRVDIEKILKQQAAQKAAMMLGEKMIQSIKRGVSPKELAVQNKLVLVDKIGVDRQAKDIPPQILKLAFNQPAPGLDKKPVVYGEKLFDGDYVVLMIKALVENTSAPVTSDQRLLLQKKMDQNFGALDYELYLMQQMSRAKISIEKK